MIHKLLTSCYFVADLKHSENYYYWCLKYYALLVSLVTHHRRRHCLNSVPHQNTTAPIFSHRRMTAYEPIALTAQTLRGTEGTKEVAIEIFHHLMVVMTSNVLTALRATVKSLDVPVNLPNKKIQISTSHLSTNISTYIFKVASSYSGSHLYSQTHCSV